jgi:death-on-curing protein
VSTRFLVLDEILALHAHMIARYAGSDGIRDTGMLESALAMPRASFQGVIVHPTLHEQAAAYLFHLVKHHPFIDGNKRIALGAALVFLDLNGIPVVATEHELVDLTIAAATGKTTKAEVATFLRAHS